MLDKSILFLKDNKRQPLFLGITLVVLAVLLFVLNYYYPLVIDDWSYRFIYGAGDRRIESLHDVFVSNVNHYNMWGGRVVAHVLVQTLLMLNPLLQDILNTIVFVLFLWLIYKISNYGNAIRTSIFILGFLFIWFLQPDSAGASFWLTGSVNYLWTATIILSFMFFYCSHYLTTNTLKAGKNSLMKSLLFLPFGVIAGWCNENISFGILVFVLGICYLLRKDQRAIPTWCLVGFVGVVIGTVAMLAAPGNQARYLIENPAEPGNNLFSITILISRIPNLLGLYLQRFYLLVIPYFIILYFFSKQNNIDAHRKKVIINLSLLFFVIANIAFFAMIGSNFFPRRSYWGIVTFFIVALLLLITNFKIESVKIKNICLVLMTCFIAFFSINYVTRFNVFRHINTVILEREKEVIEGKKHGIMDYVFYNRVYVRDRYFYFDGNGDPEDGHNKTYSSYYGINSVRVLPKENKPQ